MSSRSDAQVVFGGGAHHPVVVDDDLKTLVGEPFEERGAAIGKGVGELVVLVEDLVRDRVVDSRWHRCR